MNSINHYWRFVMDTNTSGSINLPFEDSAIILDSAVAPVVKTKLTLNILAQRIEALEAEVLSLKEENLTLKAVISDGLNSIRSSKGSKSNTVISDKDSIFNTFSEANTFCKEQAIRGIRYSVVRIENNGGFLAKKL